MALTRGRNDQRTYTIAPEDHDAVVLADILRTDRHQEAIWARQAAVNRLRSLLVEFYPQALIAIPNLIHKAALEVLGAAPTPALGLKLTRSRIVALLRRSGRGNRPGVAERIMADLRERALRHSDRVEAAHGEAVAALVGTIAAVLAGISRLETTMTAEFEQYADSKILNPSPGLGPDHEGIRQIQGRARPPYPQPEPRQQAPRPAVVVPPKQRTVGH